MLDYKFKKLNVEFKYLKIMKIFSSLLNNEISIAVLRQRLNKWCLDYAYSVLCDYGRLNKLSLKVYLSRLYSRPL